MFDCQRVCVCVYRNPKKGRQVFPDDVYLLTSLCPTFLHVFFLGAKLLYGAISIYIVYCVLIIQHPQTGRKVNSY